jgi:hypothetical protein
MRSAYGNDITNGLNRYLDVLEATGARQRIGSQTAFNTEIRRELGKPGATAETAMAAVFGGAGAAAGGAPGAVLGALGLPQKARDALTRARLGKNMDAIGDILSKPELANKFAELARTAQGSRQSASAIGRLAMIADISANKPQRVYVTGGHY